jgi:ABC-type amino acid transport substrate-binding protein
MKRIWAPDSSAETASDRLNGEVNSPPRCLTWWHLGPLILIAALILPFACRRTPRRLDHIMASGVLRVAIDPTFAPFAVIDQDGRIIGFDADLADRIADRLGVDAHLVTTGYDALYDALTVDHADVIISALYPDLNRSADFAFSRPYFDAGQVLVVKDDDTLEAAADLAGRSIACVFGTTGHMEALRLEAALDPAPTLTTAEDWTAAAELLRLGRVDAAILDHVSAQTLYLGDTSFRIVRPSLTAEPYVVATRREDEDLLRAIDEILQVMEREGEIAALVARWMHP